MKKTRAFFLIAAVLCCIPLVSCIPLSAKQIVNGTGSSITVYTTYNPGTTYTLSAGDSVTVSEPNWSSPYASSLPTDTRVVTKSEYNSNGKVQITTFYELTDTYSYKITSTSSHVIYVVERKYGISSAGDKNTLTAAQIAKGGNETVSVYTSSPSFRAYYLLDADGNDLSDPGDFDSLTCTKVWTGDFTYESE